MASKKIILYYKRPEAIARAKAYHQSPVAKMKRRVYRQREDVIAREKVYQQRPEVKAKIKAYRQTPEYISQRKGYYKRFEVKARVKKYLQSPKIMAKRRAQSKARFSSDQRYRLMVLLRSRLRHAFKKYSTTGKIKKIIEYDIDSQAIFEHIGSMPDDGQDYHIDHIIPLCSFNFDNPIEIKQAFAPENHQWLTAEANMKKGGRLPITL